MTYDELNALLCQHHWKTIEEWIQALDELADYTEDEIEDLVKSGGSN